MFARHVTARWGVALSLMVATLPVASFADTFDLGSIPPGQNRGHVFGHGPGSFTDTVQFAVTVPGDGRAEYFNFYVSVGGVLANIRMRHCC